MDTNPEHADVPGPETGSPRRRRRAARIAVAGLLAAGLLGAGGLNHVGQLTGSDATPYGQRQDWPHRATAPGTVQSATAKAKDATATQEVGVAYINTTLDYGAGAAAGTGMILTSDGEVLTNHHVIEGATSIKVQVVSTGATYTADVVGYDAANDVAVLRLRGALGLDTVPIDATARRSA